MSATVTLDTWTDRVPIIAELALTSGLYSAPHASGGVNPFSLAIRVVASAAGSSGFTVDDLRAWFVSANEPFPLNPGATLGALCARGVLRAVDEQPSAVRSSKGRRVRRFILAEGIG